MSKKFNKNNKDQQILKKIFYTYIDNYFFHLDLNNDYRIFSEVVALHDISASDLLSER